MQTTTAIQGTIQRHSLYDSLIGEKESYVQHGQMLTTTTTTTGLRQNVGTNGSHVRIATSATNLDEHLDRETDGKDVVGNRQKRPFLK